MDKDSLKITMITSLDELDSLEAFDAFVVVPIGGMALQGLSWDGGAEFGNKVEWFEAGSEKTRSSSEIFSNWVLATGDKEFKARLLDWEE